MASEETKKVVEKVQKLCALAGSDNEEEASTAALQAVRMMKEHKLSLIATEDLERAQKVIAGAQELQKRAEANATKKMALGALAGYLFAGGKLR